MFSDSGMSANRPYAASQSKPLLLTHPWTLTAASAAAMAAGSEASGAAPCKGSQPAEQADQDQRPKDVSVMVISVGIPAMSPFMTRLITANHL